jgi:hypothetical protein
MIRRRLLLPFSASLIALIPPDPAFSQTRAPQIVNVTYVVGKGSPAKIVNGSPTTWYPSVGALLYGRHGSFSAQCTATLVGCSSVLTAAHCIADDTNAANYRVFFQQGGMAEVASIEWQRERYVKPTALGGSRADIAFLKLMKPITGIAPQPINHDREHAPDLKGTIVGFGRTGGTAENFGLKRFGEVTVASCNPDYDQSQLVCWNYRGHDESNTCEGDSGGPLLLSEGRPHEVMSAVTSGGMNPSCVTLDHSFDTSVFHFRSWIKSAAGADLGTGSCGSEPPLIDNRDRYRSFSGQMDTGSPMHVFEVEVKGAQALRVGANLARALNAAQADITARPQLSVTSGKSADTARPPCASNFEGPATFCTVANPPDGIYTIVLQRVANQGRADFQLVVSVF